MREPELAWSVWLPLALVRVVQAVQGAFGGADAVSDTSDLLDSMSLPAMANAARRDEAEARQAETIRQFNIIKQRFANNGGN